MSETLFNILQDLGLPTDFSIKFRKKSKSHYGRYYVNRKLVVLYYENGFGKRHSYSRIVKTAIHEALHHYQYHHQPGYIRMRGIMHDKKFKEMENNMYKLVAERGYISE